MKIFIIMVVVMLTANAEHQSKEDKMQNGVLQAYSEDGKPRAEAVFQNDRAISAKCHNGKVPTKEQIQYFNQTRDVSDLCGE